MSDGFCRAVYIRMGTPTQIVRVIFEYSREGNFSEFGLQIESMRNLEK